MLLGLLCGCSDPENAKRTPAAPIDDVRGTAAYRRHALSVLARRTLGWAWRDYQGAAA